MHLFFPVSSRNFQVTVLRNSLCHVFEIEETFTDVSKEIFQSHMEVEITVYAMLKMLVIE